MNVEHPSVTLRNRAFYYVVTAARQRREMNMMLREMSSKSMDANIKINAELFKLLKAQEVFDQKLQHYRDYVYRAEFEEATASAENAAAFRGVVDTGERERQIVAADEWLQRTMAVARGLKRGSEYPDRYNDL